MAFSVWFPFILSILEVCAILRFSCVLNFWGLKFVGCFIVLVWIRVCIWIGLRLGGF